MKTPSLPTTLLGIGLAMSACRNELDTTDTADTAYPADTKFEEVACPSPSDEPRYLTWSLYDERVESIGATHLVISTRPEYLIGLVEYLNQFETDIKIVINLRSSLDEFAPDGTFLPENYVQLVESFGEIPNLQDYVIDNIEEDEESEKLEKIAGWMLDDDIGLYHIGGAPTREDFEDLIIPAIDSTFGIDPSTSPSFTYFLRDDLDNDGNDLEAHGIELPFEDDRVVIYVQYTRLKDPNPQDWLRLQAQAATIIETDADGREKTTYVPFVIGFNLDFANEESTGASSAAEYGTIDSHTPGRYLARPEDIDEYAAAATEVCPGHLWRGVWGLTESEPSYEEITEYIFDPESGYIETLYNFGHVE